MAKAVELRTSTGSSVEREWAQNQKGKWFTRHREKGRYGWAMTRWEPIAGDPPPPGEMTLEHQDYGTMPFGSWPKAGHERLRLPW